MRTKRKLARFGAWVVFIFFILLILVVLAAGAFFVLQISGKNRLYTDNNARPNLSDGEGIEEVLPHNMNEEDTYVWQEGDVRYNGTIYRYNEDILTFLFMGIDKLSEVKEVENQHEGGQSDALFLLVLNPKTHQASIVGVPRDTMTEVATYSKDGEYTGTATMQICLQHGYGDGAELSCERTVEAVSHLFYDLPIHGYCAINMGAIPILNDAVGGIEVEMLQDADKFGVKKGDVILLEGINAYHYLQSRDTKTPESAARRLDRQKQYLVNYAAKAIEKMKTDVTLPVTLYNSLNKYMVTDITVDEVSYLATQVLDYHFSGEQMYSLQGEIIFDGRYECFYADETVMYELILDIFYEEMN